MSEVIFVFSFLMLVYFLRMGAQMIREDFKRFREERRRSR